MSSVWRLASGRYQPLTGEGARLAGGRWNSSAHLLIYTSESPALCLAECLVHVTGSLPLDYQAFKIAVPDNVVEHLDTNLLNPGWQQDVIHTRKIGDQWLVQTRSLALAVPSAVLPESVNVLLNPIHHSATQLRIVEQFPFGFYPRLRPAR